MDCSGNKNKEVKTKRPQSLKQNDKVFSFFFSIFFFSLLEENFLGNTMILKISSSDNFTISILLHREILTSFSQEAQSWVILTTTAKRTNKKVQIPPEAMYVNLALI